MECVRDGNGDIERVRKRCRVDKTDPGIVSVHTTAACDGNNASMYDRVTSDLEYSRQYSNPLFPRVQSVGVHGEQVNRGPLSKTYHGETNVGGSAILVQGDITHNHYHLQGSQQDKYDVLLDSLTFDRMDARLRNVAMPFANTCQWFFDHESFNQWIDRNRTQEHHGFFWIKGKPGSGKSTIMKEVVTWAQRTWKSEIVLAYFFNARSPQYLEKSTLGLYRFLLHQLLLAHPDGHQLFVDRFASKIRAGKVVEEWSHVELQNFLTELISRTNPTSMNVFVDALDEGDTNDIRQMISFLEQLTRYSVAANVFTRICLSSRHYPHISVRKGLSLVLEDQSSHTTDIDKYIQNELADHDSPQMDKLRQEVRDRSAGVFLWVVLVIPFLKRGFDCGKSVTAMRRELSGIPQDLRDMFVEILSRDAEGMDECMALLRWVLFSQRPLSMAEAYDALKQASLTTDIREDVDLHDVTLVKYLLHCSRGLIEFIEDKSDWRTLVLFEFETRKLVQFIHETVREFLLGERGSERVPGASNALPDTALDFRADICHMAMAEECMRYVLYLSRREPLTKELLGRYPLAGYAAQYWHDHLHACSTQATQGMFDLACEILTSAHDHKLLATLKTYGDDDNVQTTNELAPPLCRAVHTGMPELVSTLLSQDPNAVSDNGSSNPALIMAAHYNFKDVLQVFFNHGANLNVLNKEGETALSRAADRRHEEIVKMLLRHGAMTDVRNKDGQTALYRAAKQGHKEIVRILLDHSADVGIKDEKGEDSLFSATDQCHEEIVQMFLKQGVNMNARNNYGETALSRAIDRGRPKMVQLLLEHGASVNLLYSHDTSALHKAILNGNENVVHTILKYGGKVNVPNSNGSTPLSWAITLSQAKITQLLLEHGADANGRDKNGDTLFSQALFQGDEKIARMLLENGADIYDNSVLWRALLTSGEKIVRRFVELDGNIDHPDENGYTALFRIVFEDDNKLFQSLRECKAYGFDFDGYGFSDLSEVSRKKEELVDTLLRLGSSPNIRDQHGNSMLYYAVRQNKEKVVRLLLAHGAEANAQNNKGCTPLCQATVEGRRKIIQLLLNHSADPDTELCADENFGVNVWQVSALEGAVRKHYDSVVQLLLHYGADVHRPVIYRSSYKSEWETCTLLHLSEKWKQVEADETIARILSTLR